MILLIKGMKISIETFYLFFRIKHMLILIEARQVILLIKGMKISIEHFHLFFRIKGMIISI